MYVYVRIQTTDSSSDEYTICICIRMLSHKKHRYEVGFDLALSRRPILETKTKTTVILQIDCSINFSYSAAPLPFLLLPETGVPQERLLAR